jgi:hypothetical protein
MESAFSVFWAVTDDINVVEISQYGWRDEKIDEGENGPDSLHASENKKGVKIRRKEGIPRSRFRFQTWRWRHQTIQELDKWLASILDSASKENQSQK